MPIEPIVLMHYLVDRGRTHTAAGTWETVVLVLSLQGDRQVPVVMARADAVTMAHALLQAAADAQSDVDLREGFKS